MRGAHVQSAPAARRAVEQERAEREHTEQQQRPARPGEHRSAGRPFPDEPAGHDRAEHGPGDRDDREVRGHRQSVRGSGRARQTTREQSGAVPGVQPGEHRPTAAALQLHALNVRCDVHDAVGGRGHREGGGEQRQVRRDRRGEQCTRVDGEPRPCRGRAAPAGDQQPAQRQAAHRTQLETGDRETDLGDGQPEPLLDGGQPGRPAGHDGTGEHEDGGGGGASGHAVRLPVGFHADSLR